jgi:hypothetical protein
MYFAVYALDRPGALNLRLETRPAHLEHLKAVAGRIRLAGPLMTEDGKEPRGSLIVIEADTLGEARAIMDADPYAKAGLFQSVDIRVWNWGIGKPG